MNNSRKKPKKDLYTAGIVHAKTLFYVSLQRREPEPTATGIPSGGRGKRHATIFFF